MAKEKEAKQEKAAPRPTLAGLPWKGKARQDAGPHGWPRFGVRVGDKPIASTVVPEEVELAAKVLDTEGMAAARKIVGHLLRG